MNIGWPLGEDTTHVFPPTQEDYLTLAVERRTQVNIYLINGIKLQGYLVGFDKHVVFLSYASAQKNLVIQMIYKQAISTIMLNNV